MKHHYEIVKAQEVAERLNAGWELYGDPIMVPAQSALNPGQVGLLFFQAMIAMTEDDEQEQKPPLKFV